MTARGAYDDWHDRYPVDAESDTPWHQLVKSHLEPSRDLAGKRVLEIGSGRGGFACWLASQAAKPAIIVAADFAHTAVAKGQEFARSRRIREIAWEVGDIHVIPHPSNSFDTVISCETVEHLPDPGRAMKELARVLRPGGRLFLTTPNYLGPMGLFRIYRRMAGRRYTEEGQPINRLTWLPRTMWWINRAGLDLLEVDGIGHYLPLPGAPPKRLAWMDHARALTSWVALHSFVEARKP
jgi:SAM-dependent methyltransferase